LLSGIFVLAAVLWFVVIPWVLSNGGSPNNTLLILSLVGFSAFVFLCSAAELAIAGSTFKDFDDHERTRTKAYTISQGKLFEILYRVRGNVIQFVLEESDANEQKHTAWTNSIIVIVNTCIVVLLSVITDKYAPANAPETFAVIGVTVIVTLV